MGLVKTSPILILGENGVFVFIPDKYIRIVLNDNWKGIPGLLPVR